MQKVALSKELAATTYPGRGIVIGKSKDGKKAVTAYFIMGRSANSRNRVFVEDFQVRRSKSDYLRTGTCTWKQDNRNKW